MSDNNHANVHILGKVYQVKCPEEKTSELVEAGVYLDNKLREFHSYAKRRNPETLTMMTALNICHELVQMKRQQEEYVNKLQNRIKELQTRIMETTTKQEEIDL